ncbi:hypothetical protein ACF1A5_27965 [Streptomyces sp. NPDC014864]|uniref:hypothetical protein n=1 Tax=Streptomyces sp. NPDC014864 TaxID=3364924 RepID=UPI0037030733
MALVLAVAGVAAAVRAATTETDGTDTSGTTATDSADSTDDYAQALQACAVSWNLHSPIKESAGEVATTLQKPDATGYATVGFNASFPDRCMVTVANPQIMSAEQYIQDGRDSWPYAVSWYGSVDQVDPSLLPWNATINHEGIVTLNAR